MDWIMELSDGQTCYVNDKNEASQYFVNLNTGACLNFEEVKILGFISKSNITQKLADWIEEKTGIQGLGNKIPSEEEIKDFEEYIIRKEAIIRKELGKAYPDMKKLEEIIVN